MKNEENYGLTPFSGWRDDVDRHDLPQDLGRGVPEDRLGGSCLLSDEQSLPLGAGDPERQFGGGNGLAAKHSNYSAQPSPQAHRPRSQRPVLSSVGGRQRQWLSAHSL